MADRRLAWALAAVIVRYLTTIQPHANRELARWRQRATAIPDLELRAHVLRPYDADMSAQGAALFAVLAPRRRNRQLVSLLVAYVLLWSYVDVRTERDPDTDPRIFDALLDALRPGCAISQVRDLHDGGYLQALLDACQRGCAVLPSWDAIGPTAILVAGDGRVVQAINHGPPEKVEQRLRAWATPRAAANWPEVCAAVSSPLAIHALMALAAHPRVPRTEVVATATAYRPVSALGVLCDHFIDQLEDETLTNHSYLSYYATPADLANGLGDLADRAQRGVRSLRDGERHAVILAAMTGMFFSDEKAWTPTHAPTSRAVLDAIGDPARPLFAILRTRRRLAARRRGAQASTT